MRIDGASKSSWRHYFCHVWFTQKLPKLFGSPVSAEVMISSLSIIWTSDGKLLWMAWLLKLANLKALAACRRGFGYCDNFIWQTQGSMCIHVFQRLSFDRHQCSSSWCANSSSAYKAFLLAGLLGACASSYLTYGTEMRRKSARFICTDSRVILLECVVSWCVHTCRRILQNAFGILYSMYGYMNCFHRSQGEQNQWFGVEGAINGYSLLYCHFWSLLFNPYMISWYRERYLNLGIWRWPSSNVFDTLFGICGSPRCLRVNAICFSQLIWVTELCWKEFNHAAADALIRIHEFSRLGWQIVTWRNAQHVFSSLGLGESQPCLEKGTEVAWEQWQLSSSALATRMQWRQEIISLEVT